jgi:hypothetical protein
LTGGAYDAASDENSVLFDGKEKYEIALRIKEYVDNYSEVASTVAPSSSADEILKYKKLLDIGAITDEQYQKKLRELI